MSAASWLNTAWMIKCSREAMAFRRATRDVAAAQAEVLQTILRRNRNTAFGQRHGFDRIDGTRAYQGRVPLSEYDDYREAIQEIADGCTAVLTQDCVELLEPTSGTTGGEKLIPYTASLRRQFQRAVAAWIADLFWHRPALRRGRAYWSISPALASGRRTAGGIPIGFEEDAAYLGTLERKALERLLVVPPEVVRLTEIDSFRYCTLWYLLAAADLALISVWNPTFLSTLLGPLELWQERLCRDLCRGRPTPPYPLPPALRDRFCLPTRTGERRAAALNEIFRSSMSPAEKLRAVWPHLGLISCWADAAAESCLPEVRRFFPDVEIQPKGLLATEGAVSFPLVGRPAVVLAIRSHFFEFQESDTEGNVRGADELERGGRYSVVLTTAGGLYRYRLRDLIEVMGFENRCPLIRFLGKADSTSDLVGEKLAEPFVRDVLHRAFQGHALSPSFALLVPVAGRPARYRLYLQNPAAVNGECLDRLAEEIENGLQANPHYRYAVQLGQLAPLELRRIDPRAEPAWQVYQRHCFTRGLRMGNIKPVSLDRWTGWPEVFVAAGLDAAQHHGT